MIGALHDFSPGISPVPADADNVYAKMFLGGFFNLLKIVLMCTPGHMQCESANKQLSNTCSWPRSQTYAGKPGNEANLQR